MSFKVFVEIMGELASSLLVLGLAVLIGFMLGAGLMIGGRERSAVSAGHAEYYLNAEHERQWRWKTNCVVRVKE